MPFIRQTSAGCELSVHVQPGAKQSDLAGLHGPELKVRVKAPPVEGKANAALIEYLAKVLRVRRSQCAIVRGQKSRSKVVLIRDMDAALARAELTGKMTAPALKLGVAASPNEG